ncbi:MAG: hypothetical protein PHY93_01735 [Bacteriovorax sp.]|nr:hypothetical protein [Bacteriovorax sp.]
MLKILILIALSFNIAFAKSRFTDSDKKKFMEEVKQGIATHKLENKGKVDLQIIKPGLYEELDIYYNQEKFTREEMVKLKQKYEEFSKSGIAPEKTEEEFYKFVNTQLEEINRTQVAKVKEGNVCNNWSCEEGLRCALDPKQEDGKLCKRGGRECKDNGDCCSSSCTLIKKLNKRFCVEVNRCFRPLNLGMSCILNPVCGEGECLAFNSKTSGVGECKDKNKSCKKNSDCCSNSCNSNKCIEAYVCKDCMINGKRPSRGQKCCEGLYLNDKGMCVPDAPPFVIPQVKIKLIQKFFITLGSVFIPFANADEAYDIVKGNGDKYSNFKAVSIDADIVQVKKPEITFKRKSNFNTCDISFRDDYLFFLKNNKFTTSGCEYSVNDKGVFTFVDTNCSQQDTGKADPSLFDMELALLSFDYMLLGDEGVNDYWTKSSNPESSIYGRLKAVATKHQLVRNSTNDKIDANNIRLKCMCLDVIGHDNITDKEKQKFFEGCPEYQVAQTGVVCSKQVACAVEDGFACVKGFMPQSCKSGEDGCTCTGGSIDNVTGETASGIKGKRLLVNWTKNLTSFNASLAIDNTEAYKGVAEVSTWAANDAKWNDVENRKYDLFNFSIKNSSGSVAAMGAILGALLAAGVIAVLGGFASTSILTAWAAAGIIATSSVTGGTGLWLIASLKGAWISKRPEVFDRYIRTYGCGKKETCVEYSRELNQPYNNICNVHTSANACVKNFVVYYEDTEPRYLVDPWIPKGVSKSLIFRDLSGGRTYAEKMEDGFQAAKSNMIAKNPGGEFVAEDYMRTLFVDANVLGQYTPQIGLDDKRYNLDATIIDEIKSKAKKYAIDQKFFLEGDTENLNNFADYTYEYHFKWPKTSRQKEISYPTVGLTTYLDLMANGVTANMAAGSSNAAKTFGNLNAQYLQDYLNTLHLYSDLPINQSDATKLKLINDEINKTQTELDNQKVLNALANNINLDSQLMNLNPSVIDSTAKSVGAKGDVSLSTDQKAFLNAIGTLRTARKTQLKKLEAYNKSMATGGNSERAIKIASASKNFASSFARPLSGSSSKGSGSIFGSGGTDGLMSSDKNKSDSSKNNSNFEGGNYNTFGLGSGSGSGSGAGSGSGGSSSAGIGKTGTDNKNATAVDNAGNGVSDEDSRRLAEAIEARNKSNKDKYQSKEEQSIFEKVTNAYIRNYDKVLSKKKDKDVIEQK